MTLYCTFIVLCVFVGLRLRRWSRVPSRTVHDLPTIEYCTINAQAAEDPLRGTHVIHVSQTAGGCDRYNTAHMAVATDSIKPKTRKAWYCRRDVVCSGTRHGL